MTLQDPRGWTVERGPTDDDAPGWECVTITVPGLGVVTAERSTDGDVLSTPAFRWERGAVSSVTEALDA